MDGDGGLRRHEQVEPVRAVLSVVLPRPRYSLHGDLGPKTPISIILAISIILVISIILIISLIIFIILIILILLIILRILIRLISPEEEEATLRPSPKMPVSPHGSKISPWADRTCDWGLWGLGAVSLNATFLLEPEPPVSFYEYCECAFLHGIQSEPNSDSSNPQAGTREASGTSVMHRSQARTGRPSSSQN